MDIKPVVLERLKGAYELEQAFITDLSSAELQRKGTLENWAAKDVAAHIAEWKRRQALDIASAMSGGTPERVEHFDQPNQEIFEAYRDQPWSAILDLSAEAYRAIVEQVEFLTEVDLTEADILPGQDERPLWKLIVSVCYTHSVLHLIDYLSKQGEVTRATELAEKMASSLLEMDSSSDWQGIVRYNLACHYALAGRKSDALSELEQALSLNPELTEWSKEDSDFESIRADPAYQSLYLQTE